MKSFYKFLLAGILGGTLLVACFDADDFDFDKLTYDNLNPQFHLPLLSDTLYISDAIEGDNLRFIDGQGCLVFDVGNVEMPEVTAIFELPDQQLGFDVTIPLPAELVGLPVNIPVPPDFAPSGEETIPLAFDGDDTELKSVSFSGGTIRLKNKHTLPGGTLTIEIPALKNGSQTFTKEIPVTSTTAQTFTLAGYT
ncbi:MAG: hypothetical protein LBI89_01040, partial [Prevotellaceae bacterium]|nr:hypothetical protein [Prevotellaceae bacterium]